MDIITILESAVNGGVSVLLAVIVIYWYRADTLRQLQEAKEREAIALRLAQQERDDKMMLLAVIGENNKVKSELTLAINELRRELQEGGRYDKQ